MDGYNLPLARGARTRTIVHAKLAHVLVLELGLVRHALGAPVLGVLAGKLDRVGDLLHAQVAYVAERRTTRGTTGQLGPTIRADDVARLTLHDGRQGELKTHRTLEQAEQLLQWVWRRRRRRCCCCCCHGHRNSCR